MYICDWGKIKLWKKRDKLFLWNLELLSFLRRIWIQMIYKNHNQNTRSHSITDSFYYIVVVENKNFFDLSNKYFMNYSTVSDMNWFFWFRLWRRSFVRSKALSFFRLEESDMYIRFSNLVSLSFPSTSGGGPRPKISRTSELCLKWYWKPLCSTDFKKYICSMWDHFSNVIASLRIFMHNSGLSPFDTEATIFRNLMKCRQELPM